MVGKKAEKKANRKRAIQSKNKTELHPFSRKARKLERNTSKEVKKKTNEIMTWRIKNGQALMTKFLLENLDDSCKCLSHSDMSVLIQRYFDDQKSFLESVQEEFGGPSKIGYEKQGTGKKVFVSLLKNKIQDDYAMFCGPKGIKAPDLTKKLTVAKLREWDICDPNYLTSIEQSYFHRMGVK